MGKTTAKEVRNLCQERFYKTATYVAALFCKALDKKLRKYATVSPHSIAHYVVRIRELFPEKYNLPKGMMEWRYGVSGEIDNRAKLTGQIVLLIQQYYADWDVTLRYNAISTEFQENEFSFDAKFIPEICQVHRPEDFDALFNALMTKMIQYFMSEIRKGIDVKYGTRSSRGSFCVEVAKFQTYLSLTEEDAKNIFLSVKNALAGDGWNVCIDAEGKDEVLWPHKKYTFKISALATE